MFNWCLMYKIGIDWIVEQVKQVCYFFIYFSRMLNRISFRYVLVNEWVVFFLLFFQSWYRCKACVYNSFQLFISFEHESISIKWWINWRLYVNDGICKWIGFTECNEIKLKVEAWWILFFLPPWWPSLHDFHTVHIHNKRYIWPRKCRIIVLWHFFLFRKIWIIFILIAFFFKQCRMLLIHASEHQNWIYIVSISFHYIMTYNFIFCFNIDELPKL